VKRRRFYVKYKLKDERDVLTFKAASAEAAPHAASAGDAGAIADTPPRPLPLTAPLKERTEKAELEAARDENRKLRPHRGAEHLEQNLAVDVLL
jgi:hypothetical protein